MGLYLENLNMDFFRKSEEDFGSLMGLVASEGKAIYGYYKLPYINHHLGAAQLIMRTGFRDQTDEVNGTAYQGLGLDTHISGHSVWQVRLHGMNINRKDADLLERRVAVTRMNREGMAVVNIVNADVLPSFMEDDVVRMQVAAYPQIIEYYKDEEEYTEHQPVSKDGHKWLIGEGTVMPAGLMRNRDPNSEEFEKDENIDDITVIRGTVKHLYCGKITFEGESHNAFILCGINTDYGELEIVHTVDQVDEELRCNMEVGSTVVMYGTLSADVAIYEYEKGIVKNEENNLAAMRYMFAGNDADRIKSILAEDVVYLSQSGNKYVGIDAVINQFKYVKSANPDQYFVHFAVIKSIDDGEEELEYSVGKRCLILASKEETNYESIAFLDFDEDWNICKIVTSTNPRYHFSIQKPVFEKEE